MNPGGENAKIRVGALISGGGTNLQAVVDACRKGLIDAEMAFVGSDNPNAYGLVRAADAGIPVFTVDYKKPGRNPGRPDLTPRDFDLADILAKEKIFPQHAPLKKKEAFFRTRAAVEAEILDKINGYGFDLVILAGFMRILTPWFIDGANGDPGHPRIMNIHPALLPAFPGSDGYGDTFARGCRVGGCTVHFIDYGEDSGPIIGQRAFQILPEDTLESVKKKGLELEWRLYPECIQLFAEKRIRVVAENGKKLVKILLN